MRQWDQKVHKIPVSQIVYFISQNNRYEPDAGTSHWRATVIVSLFTVKNELGMTILRFSTSQERARMLAAEQKKQAKLQRVQHVRCVRPNLQDPSPVAAL